MHTDNTRRPQVQTQTIHTHTLHVHWDIQTHIDIRCTQTHTHTTHTDTYTLNTQRQTHRKEHRHTEPYSDTDTPCRYTETHVDISRHTHVTYIWADTLMSRTHIHTYTDRHTHKKLVGVRYTNPQEVGQRQAGTGLVPPPPSSATLPMSLEPHSSKTKSLVHLHRPRDGLNAIQDKWQCSLRGYRKEHWT